MKYYFSEIRKNVFLVETENLYDLSSMFIRPQEFFESPFDNIRGKYFSLLEFMDTYAQANGGFTYLSDWSGFNIPGTVFLRFFKTFNYDLSPKESILFERINDFRINATEDFYVIGAVKNNKETFNHEIAHAYWYLYSEYKNKMRSMLRDKFKNKIGVVKKSLIERGYNEFVLEDEIQAYLSTKEKKKFIELFRLDKKAKIPSCFKEFYTGFDSAHK